jgi:tripartite ATP-independent transporter DctM subunit
MLASSFYSIGDRFVWIVIPLFVFMGVVAAKGGITKDLYNGLSLWCGRLKAGLGIATVFGCAGFGTVCGASLVVASVFGKVSAPEMRRHGYSKTLAYGICASAGMIGMLVPPSVFIVIYGVLTEQSVGALLISGLVVGLLVTVLYCLTLIVMSKVKPSMFGSTAPVKVSWRQKIGALKLFIPFAIIALIVIGGIFGGIFSPTEAASVAALAVLVVGFVTTGENRWKEMAKGIVETASVTGMIFLILGGAVVFSRFLTLTGLTRAIMDFILGLNLSPLGLVISLVVVFLFVGCLMDAVSALVISVPLFYPVVLASGIEPIWFAMVATLALEIGVITPPVGMNVYAVMGVAEEDVSLEDVFRGIAIFFLIDLVSLAIVIFIPELSTFLPALMAGK